MDDIISQNTNRKNLLQLLWLRLIAILGQVATILVVNYILEISLPLMQMFGALLVLGILSGISFYRYKSQKNISDRSLFIELLFDVAALTSQLYFSGGISNPFISLFLLQVIISAILLRAVYAWLVAIITIGCYIWLSFNYQELHAFHQHENGDFFNLHLHGMLVSYILAAALLLIFVTKIIKNLREKERLVNMGLLATGAAHELSTPLSTISVILNDWKKMNLAQELNEDVETVEFQINRCKKILSQILSSSGKTRAEQARLSPIKNIFDDLIKEWTALRNPQNLLYKFSGKNDKEIILDDILAQAFFNIFDNALEASKDWISINVDVGESEVVVSTQDHGKGFSEEVLNSIGKPNITTKNGNGLGLFLAINSFQRVGGNLKISNLTNGAEVKAIIPLKNL